MLKRNYQKSCYGIVLIFFLSFFFLEQWWNIVMMVYGFNLIIIDIFILMVDVMM